jgi:ribosomal protein S25
MPKKATAKAAAAKAKTKAGRGRSAKQTDSRCLPGLELAKALCHPLRVRILTEMNTPTRRMSPVDFATRHGEHLGTTSYHFRVLREVGCIRIVEEHQRRGATEHVYEPVKRAMAWRREWENLGAMFRDNLAASALRESVEAIGRSVDSGKFAAREDSVLAHDTCWVDQEGWEEIQTLFVAMLHELLLTTERVEERIRNNPDRPAFLLSYLMASFESPLPGDIDGDAGKA